MKLLQVGMAAALLIAAPMAGPMEALAAPKGEVVGGMSKVLLGRVRTKAEDFMAQDKLAGTVVLVWRRGQVVDVETVGWADKEAKVPMKRDTIFHLASMSKPVTSAALMMLVEIGRAHV